MLPTTTNEQVVTTSDKADKRTMAERMLEEASLELQEASAEVTRLYKERDVLRSRIASAINRRAEAARVHAALTPRKPRKRKVAGPV